MEPNHNPPGVRQYEPFGLNNPDLSILIPVAYDRVKLHSKLIAQLKEWVIKYGLEDRVEIISWWDNKEMTIGEKREWLYKYAKGKYSWQLDSDDWIPEQAIPRILEVIEIAPADCITFEEACTIDGVQSRSNFSLKYVDWGENMFGYDHVRTPFFKTPILTTICQQVPVPHVRFGEDHLWSQAIKPLLQSETHIPLPLYHYNHTSSPHNERYGIKE